MLHRTARALLIRDIREAIRHEDALAQRGRTRRHLQRHRRDDRGLQLTFSVAAAPTRHRRAPSSTPSNQGPGAMKFQSLAMIAVILLPGAAIHAASVPGNLSVVTQIDAACSVPSPNGNLTLPFQGTATLTNQPVSFPVVISSSCTGSAIISHLEFGDGLHATADSSQNPGTKGDASHTHTRRLRGQNLTGEYIAYKMFSDSAGTTEIMTSVTGAADCSAATSGTCNNAIYFDGDPSSITVSIYGRIHDETGTYASRFDINGDIYNDTVVMTLHYE
jgi:spore coat protein U-like protein